MGYIISILLETFSLINEYHFIIKKWICNQTISGSWWQRCSDSCDEQPASLELFNVMLQRNRCLSFFSSLYTLFSLGSSHFIISPLTPPVWHPELYLSVSSWRGFQFCKEMWQRIHRFFSHRWPKSGFKGDRHSLNMIILKRNIEWAGAGLIVFVSCTS